MEYRSRARGSAKRGKPRARGGGYEHDPLTGLLNRAGFNHRSRELIDRHPETEFIIIYGDIDRFKVFNDQYGTEEGDHLLAAAGAAVKSMLSEHAVVARLRADHFVACAPRDEFDVEKFLAHIDSWFASYEVKFTFFVRIGLYVVEDPSLDIALMSDRALLALREAKNGREKSRYVYYDNSLRDSLLREQVLVGEMSTALRQNQFEIFFQPQYCYSTGTVVGAEALVRWRHPSGGIMTPSEFVPVFERNNLITTLDYFVWEEACRALRDWLERFPQDKVPCLSVNISRVDIYHKEMCDHLFELVKRYKVPLDKLRLEITETAYMDAPEQLMSIVRCLQEKGFSVAMDDFGSGFSSLNTLKDLPVDILKLDMGFMDAQDKTRGSLILASVVRMARWLNLPVIAEGVETKEQADYLLSIGCIYMQGYLFSKPITRADYDALLERCLCQGDVQLPSTDERKLDEVWDAESHLALLFNRYVGAAVIAEYTPTEERLEIVRGNDAFRELVAADDSDSVAVFANVFSQLSAGDRIHLIAALDRAVANKAIEEMVEFSIPLEGGNVLWLRARIRGLARVGEVYSVFLQLEETTEQQATRARLRATMNSIPGGLAFFELSHEDVLLLDLGGTAQTLTKSTREELEAAVRNDIRSLIVKEDRWIVQTGIEQLLDGAEQYACTVRVLLHEEEMRWLHLSSAVVSRRADTVCVSTVIIDVTKDRQFEQRAIDQDLIQQRLYDAIPCGIVRYTLDEPAQLISMNKAGCEMLGYESFAEYHRHTSGEALSAIVEPNIAYRQSIISRLQAGEERVPFSAGIRCSDGSVRWIEGFSSLSELLNGDKLVQSAFNDATLLHEEQRKRNLQLYIDVLHSIFDEVYELDFINQRSRVIHSRFCADYDDSWRPLPERVEHWLTMVVDLDDREWLRETFAHGCNENNGTPCIRTYRVTINGKNAWCRSTFIMVDDGYGLCCNKDVSDLVTEEDRRAFARISEVMSRLPVGVGVYRIESDRSIPVYISDQMCAMFDFTREEYYNAFSTNSATLSSEALRQIRSKISLQQAIEQGHLMETTVHKKDGTAMDVRIKTTVSVQDDATLAYVVVSDVTAEHAEHRANVWLNERYRLLSEIADVISFDYDTLSDTVLLYINRTGKTVEEQSIPHYLQALKTGRDEVVHPDSVPTLLRLFECVRKNGSGGTAEYRADYYGRGYEWYRTNLYTVHDKSGEWHLVGIIRNIQNERDLLKRAEHDEMTGLSNRAATKDLINDALLNPERRQNCVCAVIDLDNFKRVNDTCGHMEGDLLLQKVGTILRSTFRKSDVLGRVGGDEFVLLLKDISLDVALEKIEFAARWVSEYQPAGFGEHPTLSVGVCAVGPDDEKYQDVFEKADRALYQAKRNGKARVMVYGKDGVR